MDIIDLRDIIENCEDDPETYEAWNKALMHDIGISLETAADNEPVAISDRDFVDYAQELADECGLLDPNPKWPLNHSLRKLYTRRLAESACRQEHTVICNLV
jgi:hypothetical protein